jgi:hypothetical protein
MSFQGILIFRAEGEADPAIIIKDSIIFARPWILPIKSIVESCSLVVSKTKATFLLLIQSEVAISIIGTRRWHSLAVDKIYLVAVSKSGCACFQGTLLDIVERSLAAG